MKKSIFDLITFKKGKFQKVKITNIFWRIFKDRAEGLFIPNAMKSLSSDQVPHSIKQTTVFKFFIQKSSLDEWKLFENPLLRAGFLGTLPLLSHAYFEQFMHNCDFTIVCSLKLLWYFTFKNLV